MTRDQMVRMKQNANTPATQLQCFLMHMLQICLVKRTSVFIQCHKFGGRRGGVGSSSFFDIRLSRAQTQNLPPKKRNLNLGQLLIK